MDNTETLPTGKRTLRRTVRGSIVGYIGGKLWTNFGDVFNPNAVDRAEAWKNEATS